MEFHFLAMFLPGFFSGYLIKQYSAFAVSAMGALLFAAPQRLFLRLEMHYGTIMQV